MEIFPQSTKCINYYPLITEEFTGPKHFVITRVHCIFTPLNWDRLVPGDLSDYPN